MLDAAGSMQAPKRPDDAIRRETAGISTLPARGPHLHLWHDLHYCRKQTGATAPVFYPCNDQKDAKAIARRPHNAPPTRDTGPRVNERIRAPEIRLIGADGENIGVITPDRAMVLAEEAGLDLVEISPNAEPPVAKIMDFGKYKYETQKKESEARKKQKIIEIKEIKFRPNTDTHDYEVKMRSVVKFLEGGDKVKITLRFRGREMAHAELGRKLLERVADDVTELGKIEAIPRLEGRQMVMMINPVKH